MPDICPVCLRSDTIEKISAMQKESRLNSPLEFPAPKKPEYRSIKNSPKFYLAVFLDVVGLFLMVATFVNQTGKAGMGIFIGIALFLTGVYFTVDARNKAIRDSKAFNNEEDKRWKLQNEIYNRIYYCKQDDICFDTESGKKVSTAFYWRLFQLQH